jgi:hypothetical protein
MGALTGLHLPALISDHRIPPDRQMVYGLELLARVHTGEALALRWRHYDPVVRPLDKRLVARSYNSRTGREKNTKTEAIKHVPVHPTLAAMLAEWKLGGWPELIGRAPGPDDLIVPLPPDAAERRRSRTGEPYRATSSSGLNWRENDLPALGQGLRPAGNRRSLQRKNDDDDAIRAKH